MRTYRGNGSQVPIMKNSLKLMEIFKGRNYHFYTHDLCEVLSTKEIMNHFKTLQENSAVHIAAPSRN